ncbi:MAG: IS110 family transposase [Candidatus Geothermincolia bacterium]
MRRVYAGMDIGSKECAAVVIDLKGKLIDSIMFKTNECNIAAFATKHPGAIVLIEECEMASWVRSVVKLHVHSVIVCDPKRNAWVAKGGNKNDRLDAAKLAELNRLGSYSAVWHTDDDDINGFKELVKHYDDTSRRLATLKCQVKARFRRQGIITRGEGVFASGRDKALCLVDNTLSRIAIEQDLELLDFLVASKAQARKSVIAASRRFPVIARFREIPGIGPILAARFVVHVGDPYRFNRRTLASYSCLAVIKRSSDGSPIGREHLSRAGNSALKDLSRTAFERAIATRRPNGIKEFYERSLARTNDRNKARLNTQRKILAIMLAIWRDGTDYSDELVTRAFPGA